MYKFKASTKSKCKLQGTECEIKNSIGVKLIFSVRLLYVKILGLYIFKQIGGKNKNLIFN